MAVPIGSFPGGIILGGFTCDVASFRVAGVALCDMRGRPNTFSTFSEHALHVSWQAQHFGRVHLNFSWQAQHFRIFQTTCRVACFLPIALARLREVVTNFRGRRGIL